MLCFLFFYIRYFRPFKKGNKSKKPGEKVFNSKFSLFTGSPYSSANTNTSSNQSWQELLEREQNAIYCKEIYNQVKLTLFQMTLFFKFESLIIISYKIKKTLSWCIISREIVENLFLITRICFSMNETLQKLLFNAHL